MKTRIKKSLTKQIMTTILCLLVGTIVACFVVNSSFLSRYYTSQKKNLLIEAYEELQEASEEGVLYAAEYDVTFENMCSTENISVIIMSSSGTPLRTSMYDSQIIQRQLMEALLNGSEGETDTLYQSENYVIQRIEDTGMEGEEYLTLWGLMEDGNFILIRTAMEGIRNNAEIANHFLLYIAAVAIVIGACISLIISRRITRPILQLTQISERMARLDFDAKYVSGTGRRSVNEMLPGRNRNRRPQMQNITENEIDKLGEHMNELSEMLEKTISELKAANNELQRDIEKKEEIDEMRKEFLSNVSHELKTPIALIQGYAEGLMDCINDDPESRQFYCEVIVDEADKMNKMVKKLLTLNQLEFGNDQVTMERFDITELVTGVVNATAILREQKGIRVEMNLPPEYVWADEFKIEEVITNYLSNAINHCDGEHVIRIFYQKKQGCLRVSVFNTGNPIPEDDLEKIWIKFYKVDKARTREYGGSGIGLSIVKATMDSMHQACGVINHENGVEFWLELDQTGTVADAPPAVR